MSPSFLSSDQLDEYRQLLTELLGLRQQLLITAEQRLLEHIPDGSRIDTSLPDTSSVNLAHYLAFRQHDLTSLQQRLTRVGLSSLAHCEEAVLPSLDRVIEALLIMTKEAVPQDFHSCAQQDNHNILPCRAEALFGQAMNQRKTRIMLTLPSEAAHDPMMVRQLLNNGVECVRINCAHDDIEVWHAMVINVRQAAEETGQSCRILIDLAGQKIRTGQILSSEPIRRLPVYKKNLPSLEHLSSVILTTQGTSAKLCNERVVPIPEDLNKVLRINDQLRFRDIRGKQRYLTIKQALANGDWLCSCNKNSYLASDTTLHHERQDIIGRSNKLGEYKVEPFPGQAVEIRLYKEQTLLLRRDDQNGGPAILDSDGSTLAPAHIGCTLPTIIDQLKPGHSVWFDDGKMGCVVECIEAEGAYLRVTHAPPRGFLLRPDKGLNFPDTSLDLPALTDKDRQDLDFAVKHADLIGFSFVQTCADLNTLISELRVRNAGDLPIIAKIETHKAVTNLANLLLNAVDHHPLGVMIARGDLAVELGSVQMAQIQEEILWLCEAAHTPVIWATQVLESLAKKGRMSRPELTDAAMSVRAECVMLNKGPFIQDAINILNNILSRMSVSQDKKVSRLRALSW